MLLKREKNNSTFCNSLNTIVCSATFMRERERGRGVEGGRRGLICSLSCSRLFKTLPVNSQLSGSRTHTHTDTHPLTVPRSRHYRTMFSCKLLSYSQQLSIIAELYRGERKQGIVTLGLRASKIVSLQDSLLTFLQESSDAKAPGLRKKIGATKFISITYLLMDIIPIVTKLS